MEDRKLVITIGRQYGAGGREIGKRLSRDLGISFYDKQILRMVSDESGIGESYFHLADEKAGGHLLYKIVKGLKPTLTSPSLGPDLVSEDNLFLFQSEVIRKLAASENCIIIGRCADYILEDAPNIVKIFVYSKMDERIRCVMDYDKVSEKEAIKSIKQYDKERNEYYRYYTGKDWGDLDNYHLCIDNGMLGFDKSVAVIKQYLKVRGLV